MRIVRIFRKKFNGSFIPEVVTLLKKGGVIIFPTETAYALGGDALNKEVIKKIFSLKARSKKNPLPVIVGTFNQAQDIAVFNSQSRKIAKKYWPGPLTLILKKKKKVPSLLTANKKKIAIRVSGLKLARELSQKLNKPLISTSANISGKKECYTVESVLRQSSRIKKGVDLILDAGRLPKVRPSTIIEIEKRKIKVLRAGPVIF